jgi:hypothetical protein
LAWQNDDIKLFHGCTNQSVYPRNASGIVTGSVAHGIDPSIGAVRPDFGQGFYTTTSVKQAKSWANVRATRLYRKDKGVKAIVLGFSIRRNDLADLQALVFVNDSSDYWSFVRYCRAGLEPHARKDSVQEQYDVVYGPVSLAAQELVIKDCDQISFHTPQAVLKISAVSIVATGEPLFGTDGKR